MAGPLLYDRVQETSVTTGTGAFALAGAVTGYRTFASVLSVGDTIPYCIAAQGGTEWEVGIGTYSADNTLTRTTVLASSNAGSAVNFSAGAKNVFLTYPAGRAVLKAAALTSGRIPYVTSNGELTDTGEISTASDRLYVGSAGAGLVYKGIIVDNSVVNAGVVPVLAVGCNSTGTPTTNFGAGIAFLAESSTTTNQDQAAIKSSWNVATHASRAADLTFSVYSTTTEQEGIRLRAASGGIQVGVFGVTPVARASAYTQTYSTATKTHSNPTTSSLTDSTGGTAGTTIQSGSPAYLQSRFDNNFASVTAQLNALMTDVANVKQVLNSVIDDLQAYGWLQ
jgi:hypothetical protein